MDVVGPLFAAMNFVMHEAALFAATGFILLGLNDLAVDLIWVGRRLVGIGAPRLSDETLPPPRRPGRLAIFIPAWDEAAVIGKMLRNALSAWPEGDYRIYVGCYPNDPDTLAVVGAVEDPRVRMVIGAVPGPTTKAACLNQLWQTLRADQAAEGRNAKAVVLHDAEDVVHPAELRVFDQMIERHDLVQLPVIPLIHRHSRWIGGHYADEFAEAHGKELVVRAALGAALPSAGVGCAFSLEALEQLAAENGGNPFDAESLTEDYELGLRIGALGGTAAFARVATNNGSPVAVREYFPSTFHASVAQKARWMTGIALSGWDRLGWSGSLGERWMRLRDRQALVAALLLASGYLAFGLWLLLKARQGLIGIAPTPVPPGLAELMMINFWMLLWRLAMRCGFVTRTYGLKEGLRSIPRAAVGNVVAMAAAAEALTRYRSIRRTGKARWGKTAHVFPAEVPAE